jgi:hypothetical protein
MYGWSNSKKSSLSSLENISSSSTHFDQDQKEQSSVQKEELNSTSLGKSDDPVSRTRGSGSGRTENVLAEEDDCSTSSSDVDDDDNTDDEYDEQELLLEFICFELVCFEFPTCSSYDKYLLLVLWKILDIFFIH